MKNRLVGLLVFALVAFNLYAQSDQSKKGLLTFTGTRIISFDPMREMPKMAWYSENQDIRVDEEVLFNNQSSLLIPSVRGKKTEAYFGMNNRDITGKTIVFKGKYKYQQANNAKVSFVSFLKSCARAFRGLSSARALLRVFPARGRKSSSSCVSF